MVDAKPKKDKDYTGFPGDCNNEQLKALEEFRMIVAGMGLGNPPYDDAYLLRFLRARKFDIKKTDLMFKAFIEWRQKHEVDTILKTYVFNELPEVKQFYPHGYHKVDKLGRPIYIERIGLLKLQQLFQITSEERLIKYYIQSYEILLNRIFPACSKLKGERVDQTLTILDLKHVSMKMMSKQVYNFIQLASKVAQDNYPEILGKMFIINAPLLFSGVWQVIKPWLDEKTRNKIVIIGSGYKSKLLEFIDEENLPEFLDGGKCNCGGVDCLEKNLGPWNVDGKDPLFPGEYKVGEETQAEGEEDDDEEEKNNIDDLNALKNALAGMNIGQAPAQKGPQNPDKYELTTQGGFGVSETPLNTQIAEGDEDN